MPHSYSGVEFDALRSILKEMKQFFVQRYLVLWLWCFMESRPWREEITPKFCSLGTNLGIFVVSELKEFRIDIFCFSRELGQSPDGMNP